MCWLRKTNKTISLKQENSSNDISLSFNNINQEINRLNKTLKDEEDSKYTRKSNIAFIIFNVITVFIFISILVGSATTLSYLKSNDAMDLFISSVSYNVSLVSISMMTIFLIFSILVFPLFLVCFFYTKHQEEVEKESLDKISFLFIVGMSLSIFLPVFFIHYDIYIVIALIALISFIFNIPVVFQVKKITNKCHAFNVTLILFLEVVSIITLHLSVYAFFGHISTEYNYLILMLSLLFFILSCVNIIFLGKNINKNSSYILKNLSISIIINLLAVVFFIFNFQLYIQDINEKVIITLGIKDKEYYEYTISNEYKIRFNHKRTSDVLCGKIIWNIGETFLFIEKGKEKLNDIQRVPKDEIYLNEGKKIICGENKI